MDPLAILTVLGFALSVVGAYVGVVGMRKARAADRRAVESDAKADQRAQQQDRQMRQLLGFLDIEVDAGSTEPLGATEKRPYAVAVADVNNDGRDELLVASAWGPHSSMLHVFGQGDDWPGSFGKLVEFSSGTPAGFTVGDLDGDGRVEVATVQPLMDYPYATGIREEVLYRWQQSRFEVADSRNLPRPGEPGFDDPTTPMLWHDGWSVLTVR